MAPSSFRHRFGFALSAGLLSLPFTVSCGTDGHPPPPASFAGYEGGTGKINTCLTPSEGCPCNKPGDVAECGETVHKYTDYVVCSTGTRTCSPSGTWGSCNATGSAQVSMDTSKDASSGLGTASLPRSTYRLQSLGTSGNCATSDPCDPYSCSSYVDTPTGVDAGADSGIKIADAGLTTVSELVPVSVCSDLSLSGPSSITVTQLSPSVSPSTATFTAALKPDGCFPGPTPALWSIDRYDIATIDKNGVVTLVTPIATPIKVTAYAGTLSKTLTLDVTVKVVDTSAAPSGYTASSFTGGLGSADTATMLYPYANTVLPLGLLPPRPQWSKGTLGTAGAVKISLRYPASGATTFDWSEIIKEDNSLYLDPPTNSIMLAAGPRATIPSSVWSLFEQTAQGSSGALVLQRKTGSTLRPEISVPLTFATGQLKGTVYYQSYGTRLVQNFSKTYSGSDQTIGGGQRFGAATLAINPGASYPTVAAGYTSSSDGPGCRVCHSASADGSKLLTNLYGARDSAIFRLGIDAPSGGTPFTPTPNDGKYAWGALYPDGSLMLSNSGPSNNYGIIGTPGLDGCDNGTNGPALYSTVPGATFGQTIASSGMPSGLKIALPVFSPDGAHVAFNHWAGTISSKSGDHRSLAMADFNASTKAFSNFRRLYNEPTTACYRGFHPTDPCTSVWPSFLPDGSGVVFEREVFNNGRVAGAGHADFAGTRSGCDGTGACGDDGTKGELWFVTTGSTPAAIAMNQANGRDSSGTITIPTDTTGSTPHTSTVEPELDYEPTVNPQEVGGYYWVAFTSRRLYGNIATLNPWWSDPRFKPIGGGGGPTPKKIWVAAIKKGATGTTDPSYPAFYLPGQELLAGNSKAYWVLEGCRTASNTKSDATLCDTNLDCCGAPASAVCALDTPITNPPQHHCIPTGGSSCIADGSATPCTADAQCCGFATGSRCGSGTCGLPPPISVYQPGSFSRDFYGSCPAGQVPIFRLFEWKALLPSDSSVTFTVRTAADPADLASANEVDIITTVAPDDTDWTTGPDTIDALLRDAGEVPQPYIRITFYLTPSSDQLSSPTVLTWRQSYDCVDAR